MSTPSQSRFSGSRSRRALFRVEFPFGRRPRLTRSGASYEVLDISERGVRLNVEGRPPFPVGARVRATITFDDGTETVEGTVLRGNEREAVIQLTEGLTLQRIRREERRVIRATRSVFPPGS